MDSMELAYLMAAAANTNFGVESRKAVSALTLQKRGLLDGEFRITPRGLAIANAALAAAVAVERTQAS